MFTFLSVEELKDLGAREIENLGRLRCAILTHEQCKKVIPHGHFCYDERGTCPFWDRIDDFPERCNGFCHYLNTGDWQETQLLWDMVKECGINEE